LRGGNDCGRPLAMVSGATARQCLSESNKMPSDREKLEVESLAAVADRMSNAEHGSRTHTVALAEFTRRQTLAQLQATQAQIDAAEAAKETAIYTRQNAKYLLWSVIVLASSSVLSLILTAVGLWSK